MEHFLRHWVAGVYGLLVDQAGAFTEAGGQIVAGSHGRSYAVVGGKAYPGAAAGWPSITANARPTPRSGTTGWA
jgi:hypothetical protein